HDALPISPPCKMHDERDERDEQENGNQAPSDVEYEPAQEPGDQTDDEHHQEQRKKHGRSPFRPPQASFVDRRHSTRSPGAADSLLDSREPRRRAPTWPRCPKPRTPWLYRTSS